jgi:hypothetical protein
MLPYIPSRLHQELRKKISLMEKYKTNSKKS